MDFHVAAHIAGAIGDILNLVGAWILALDVIRREREWKEEKDLEEFAERVRKMDFGASVSYEDIVLTRPGAVALAQIIKTVHRGRLGLVIIIIGFTFLLLYRLLEIVAEIRTS